MIYQLFKSEAETQTIAQTTNFTAVNLVDKGRYVKGYSVQIVGTVATPSAATFTADAGTDVFTATAHGFLTGLKVQVSNSGGALPTGLSAATDYFVIRLTANTFKLATSLVNANAGTAIDISDAGTGTQTATPTALAGANYKLQASVDNTNWSDIGSAVNITATANFITQVVDPMYQYVRVVYTMTAGTLTLAQTISVIGV